jgi:8-oxo-dGTP pyrophosphatase MutT (NUDIX family)
MEPRHTGRGIVVHEDKILLIERWRDNLHYFSIPGGGIEPGETSERTAVREIAEETSCLVTIERPLYVLKAGHHDHHIYLCQYRSGEPHLPADSPEALENDPNNRFAPIWLPLKDLRADLFYIWRPVIERLLIDLQTGFKNQVVEIVVDEPG